MLTDSERRSIDDESVEEILIEATYQECLRNCADTFLAQAKGRLSQRSCRRIEAVVKCCQSISDYALEEERRIVEACQSEGITVYPRSEKAREGTLQYHLIILELDPNDIDRALSTVSNFRYERFNDWHPSAWTSYKRFYREFDLIKTDSVTTRLTLRWGASESAGQRRGLFRPTPSDYRSIRLPASLWRTYPAIHCLRWLTRKLSYCSQEEETSWPFLGTPDELLGPLLKLVELDKNDHLLDVGSGDGRIVIEAARTLGCQTIGIESDPLLCEIARKKAREAALEKQVTIHEGRFQKQNVQDASVVFLFLPSRSIPGLLEECLESSAPGSRIILHEQERIDFQSPPQRSQLLLGQSALTVAHFWVV